MPIENEIRNFIQAIPKIVKSLTYDEVVKLCNYYFSSFVFPTADFTIELFFFRQKEWSGWNVIYRGRKLTGMHNRPYSNVSDISYIQEKDIESIKNFGRANKKGESMFYGSLNASTACIETLSKGVDFRDTGAAMLVLGTWKFEAPLKLAEMPHSEKYWKLFYDIAGIKSETITDKNIKEQNEELKLQIRNELAYEILTLFGDAFAKFGVEDDSDYYLSNYFADRVFNKIPGFGGENIDGIIYPSVPNSYQQKNIVLKPEVVNTKLKFVEAAKVWAVHFMKTGGGAQFNPIEDRIYGDDNAKLKWRDSGI